jgi:cytochrome c-type biogenesis protein CcmE
VGASIRLGGLVADHSIVRAPGSSQVEFDVIDRPGGRVHVKCNGVPPQLFRERIGVVVEGTLSPAGHFEGRRLMVSHSNEYRVPGEGEAVDVKKTMRTTQGLDEGPAPTRP